MEYKIEIVCIGECSYPKKIGTFHSIKKWRKHITKTHYKKCKKCDKKFDSLKETRRHFFNDHLVRKYLCVVCEYEGDSKSAWRDHRCEKCTVCKLFFTKCMCENGPAQLHEEYLAWLVDPDANIPLTDPNPWNVSYFHFIFSKSFTHKLTSTIKSFHLYVFSMKKIWPAVNTTKI